MSMLPIWTPFCSISMILGWDSGLTNISLWCLEKRSSSLIRPLHGYNGGLWPCEGIDTNWYSYQGSRMPMQMPAAISPCLYTTCCDTCSATDSSLDGTLWQIRQLQRRWSRPEQNVTLGCPASTHPLTTGCLETCEDEDSKPYSLRRRNSVL